MDSHLLNNRPNLLVVFGRNKRRSRTAEFLFKNDNRFSVRSAGISPKSDRKISEKDIHWANLILVMENNQRSKIREMYRHLEIPKIEILNIPDDYEFMNEELIGILTEKINDSFQSNYDI
jgi:protein-tyrosine phosphatase